MSRAAASMFVGLTALVVLGARANAAREASAVATRQLTFSSGPDLGQRRLDHTATRLADGRTLVVGGFDGASMMSAALLLDPVTRRVTATGSLQTARSHHTATLLGDGRVLIAGGHLRPGPTERLGPLSSAEIYDPATGRFTPTGSMTSARVGQASVLLASGKVLVCGGSGDALPSGAMAVFATAELFDPETARFTAAGTMTVPRNGHSATLLITGQVLVTAGGTAEVYDPPTDRFARTGNPASRRSGHTATLLGDGHVLLVGGLFNSLSLATAERYDPQAAVFRPTGGLSTPRTTHTATLLDDGRVLVTGGYVAAPTTLPDGRNSTSFTPTPTAEVYDPAAGTFSSVGSLLVARAAHAAAPFPGGVWVTGGSGNGGTQNTSEIFLVAPSTPRAAPAAENRAGAARGVERLYSSSALGWSISYPQGWNVNDQDQGFVQIRRSDRPQFGLVGIQSGTVAVGMTLDGFADTLMTTEARRPGFRILSRTRTTLGDGTAALEVINVLGVGTVGKSRKLFAIVGGTGFCVNAESYLESWPDVDAAFERMIASFAPPPFWRAELARARSLAAAGNTYVLTAPSGVSVFNNNAKPFCYMYTIPGEWMTAPEPSAWRSKDGGAFVGVLFPLARDLEGLPGRTLAERSLNGITRRYEQGLGRKLTTRIVPLESTQPRAWEWTAAPLEDRGRQVSLATKIVVDLSPRGVMEMTLSGIPDAGTLARRIIETLKTTSDAPCYWPVLEGMLKALK